METLDKDNNKSLLRNRARKLALTVKSNSAGYDESLNVVYFSVGGDNFCIESLYINEIITLKDITVIPGVPSFIHGITNLRGRIIAVFNFSDLFNLKKNEITISEKVIVLEHKEHQKEFGILTDKIHNTEDLHIRNINPLPVNFTGSTAKYIIGLTDNGTFVIDAGKFILSSALVIDNTVKNSIE